MQELRTGAEDSTISEKEEAFMATLKEVDDDPDEPEPSTKTIDEMKNFAQKESKCC